MENTPAATIEGCNPTTETGRGAPVGAGAPPRDQRAVVFALPAVRPPLVDPMPMALAMSHGHGHGRVIRGMPAPRPIGVQPLMMAPHPNHHPLVHGLPVAPLPAGYGYVPGARMAAPGMTVGYPPVVRGWPAAAYLPANRVLPYANAVRPVRTLTADTSSHMKCVLCHRVFAFGRPLTLVDFGAGTVLRPPSAPAVAATPFRVCSDTEHFKLTILQTGTQPVLFPWRLPTPQPGGQIHADSESPSSSSGGGPDPAGIGARPIDSV